MKKNKNILLVSFDKIKDFYAKLKSLFTDNGNKLFLKKREKKTKVYFNKKKNLFTGKKLLKYSVPVGAFIILLVLFLGGRIVPEMLSGNVYRITELNDALDKVKAGDKINYTINGYNNWRVLSVDKENGTIDVTSNTNIKDLTIEPYKTVDEYNAIFQAEADAFRDEKYVVNARTIAKSDSLMFNSDEEYWLANVNENSLMTNKTGSVNSEMIYFKNRFDYNKFYVIPSLVFRIPKSEIPEVNGTIDISINNVDKWVYMGDPVIDTYSTDTFGTISLVRLYAASPVALEIDDPYKGGIIVNSYYESFRNLQNVDAVPNAENSFGYYGIDLQWYGDRVEFINGFYSDIQKNLFSYYINNGLFENDDEIFISGIYFSFYSSNNNRESRCIEKKYNTHCEYSVYKYTIDGHRQEWDNIIPKTLTFGYRPVLTLKVSDNEVGKTTKDNLSIGDHVKYNANGYKNWKVLSIDKDAGTVDVISGGVVKNIGMYGTEDYENYENILQNEVDAYKVGSYSVSARPIGDSDVEKLMDMGDSVSAMYWYNAKQSTERQTTQSWSSTVYNEMSYEVGVLWTNTGDYYINDLSNSTTAPFLRRYWVRFYSQEMDSLNDRKFSYYIGNGDMSYIAGLRPIITLKLDSVQAYSDSEAEQIENTSHDYDTYYISEQYQNNFKDDTSSLLFRHSSDSTKITTKKNSSQSKLDGIVDEDDCDYGTDYDSYGSVIDADLVETNEILEVAVFLSVIYGLIMIGLAIFAIVYRQKKKNQFLDS